MSDMPGSYESGQPASQQSNAETETAGQHPDFLKKPAQQPPTQPVETPQQPGQPQPGQPQPGQGPAQPPSFQQPPTQIAPVQPMPGPPAPGAGQLMGGEPVLVSIGDISVTATQVFTPSGTRPLSDVQWSVTDMSLTNEGIPTWAIVCAIVFFVFCFLGLLFLLVKERTTKGSVQVSVYGSGFAHTTQIQVFSPEQVADIHARVSYVRTLNAAMPGQPYGGSQGPLPGPGQQPGQGW